MGQTRFLDSLTQTLGDRAGKVIFPCIRDLATNGLQLSRLSSADPAPNRQDVTQYLGAWCRFAGLDEVACREWLSEYAVVMLASITKASASRIRHSTKSNLRYIFRDEVDFVCGREANRPRAHCSHACPVYAEMENKPVKAPHKSPAVQNRVTPVDVSMPATPAAVPVKQRYREQFEAALQLIRRELEKGTAKSAILDLLGQQEMKTRTGRKWTSSTLSGEIRKLKESDNSDPDTLGATVP